MMVKNVLDDLMIDQKKCENFIRDCLVVLVEEGRSDDESIYDGIILMYT